MDNLIFDRTQTDVTYAAELNRKLGRGESLTAQELADWNAGLKGAYNAADMNRVDAAVRELGGMLTAAGYPVRYTSPVLQPESEYTPLDYIESSGTQYIDTGYKPNFVPAEKNGVIGLYDKAEKKMYGNSGTGDFIAGEVVPQPQPEPTKTEFETGDIIKYDIWRTYLDNVQAIRDAYYIMTSSPELPEPTAPLTFDGANAIEKLLYDVQVLYNSMLASYRKCGTFQAGNNKQRLPLKRSVT